MFIEKEFQEAVKQNNLLLIKIMLKDSMIVDRSFEQFNQMVHYVEDRGLPLWEVETEECELDKRNWSFATLDKEMVEMVSCFTHSRVNLVKAMISALYPLASVPRPQQKGYSDSQPRVTGMLEEKVYTRTNLVKWNNFRQICTFCREIAEIQKKIRAEEKFSSSDIKVIQKKAEEIVKQCKEINGR